MLELDKVFSLLTEAVPKEKAAIFINKCKESGMREIEYIDLGLDDTLPEIDMGYNFVFITSDGVEARLEILEKNAAIMQAGIQIIYPYSFLFSNASKHFKILKNFSDAYYGESLPMGWSDIDVLNYGNIFSICYVSKGKVNGHDVINFRVGNRQFWD